MSDKFGQSANHENPVSMRNSGEDKTPKNNRQKQSAMANAAISGLDGEVGNNDTSGLEKQGWTYVPDTEGTTAGIVNTERLMGTDDKEGEEEDKTRTITVLIDTETE